jgi:hypothetical protein
MTRAFRSGARPRVTKAMIDDQKKANVKRAFRSDDAYKVEAKKGGFIKKAIKKPGSLRKSLGIKKGKTIPKAKLKAAAKKPGKLGQRARFAITLGKLRKK